ncbi:hypothetical protein ACFWUW_31260, partial [Streptomyces sp. NPDC058655]
MTAGTTTPQAPDGTGAPRFVRRLRPGVAVTPLLTGLHLRGRRGSVTLEGSTALPALWRSLEEPLRDGGIDALLDGLEPGSALRLAVETVVAQLDAHDLLVAGRPEPAARREPAERAGGGGSTGRLGDHGCATGPCSGGPGPDPVAQWLGAAARRPAAARAALAATTAEVVSGAPGGDLAGAAGRALERGGLSVSYTVDPDLPDGRILLCLRAGGDGRAVAAGVRAGTGYATAVGSAAQVRSDAQALEARLGSGSPAGSKAFASLLAGSAAHRLLCAAAGLPDPAAEGDDGRLLSGLPAVLLADSRPLRAEYRTWLGPARIDAGRRSELAPADTLREALRRVTALCDERCGALPEPLPADLPQLPVPLAACGRPRGARPGGRLVGGAPRLDLARLEVFCRAAETALGGGGFTVGANPGHARGRALREAVAGLPWPTPGYAPVLARLWSGHPQVRHWWMTLTVRLGVPARMEVVRARGEEVYRACAVCG